LLDGEDYSIAVDPLTRSLIVRASARGHRVIRELVEELDARPQSIAVDITVSQLMTPSSWALALSYQIPFGKSLDDLVGGVVSQPAAGGTTHTTPIAPGALIGRVARDAGLDFQLPDQNGKLIPIQDTGVIDAAMGRAVNEVLLQPSLVIVAGEQHEIFVGSNVPIPTSSGVSIGAINPGTPNLGSLAQTISLNRQDVGIRLTLEAQAGQEGPIVLKLDTEITALGPSVAGPIERVGPTLLKQTLSAKARLDDGETAIVGVDRERQESITQQGTPWFPDIPFLGWLFKGRSKQIPMDTRLVIAARARRLSTPAKLVADTIRRRIAFDRQRAREQNLPDSGGAPYGVRLTTRSREDDAEAIARDLESKGHRPRIQPWNAVDGRELFDVYVMGLESMSDAGDLAYRLGEDGWDADLVVFSSRSRGGELYIAREATVLPDHQMGERELRQEIETLALLVKHRDRGRCAGDQAERSGDRDARGAFPEALAAPGIEQVGVAEAVDDHAALVVTARRDAAGGQGDTSDGVTRPAWMANADEPGRAVGMRPDDREVTAQVDESRSEARVAAELGDAVGGVFLHEAAEVELHAG
jgi:hypothetical protein